MAPEKQKTSLLITPCVYLHRRVLRIGGGADRDRRILRTAR